MVSIDSVDFYYLSMPEVLDIGDGSQDLLLVRVQAGGDVGWGECEASPLTSIAALVTPMSHSACKPVIDSVLGQPLNDVADIARIGRLVRANSLDLLQADHTYSGIDMALWDLLGKRLQAPVWELLGIQRPFAKRPYASQLFGDTPEETFRLGVETRQSGYGAAKFGWGPFGLGSVEEDELQVRAAREGLGANGVLLIDVGTVWVDDLARAAAIVPVLQECNVTWLEEPFVSGALTAYSELATLASPVALAGGEGSHNVWQARHMIDHGGIGYVQIDAGRIGGISAAREVATYARNRGVTYVNHTFTSHLALSASLQAFLDHEHDVICEYPVAPKSLAWDITENHLLLDDEGLVHASSEPGLGMHIDLAAAARYLVPTEIRVGGVMIYETPELR